MRLERHAEARGLRLSIILQTPDLASHAIAETIDGIIASLADDVQAYTDERLAAAVAAVLPHVGENDPLDKCSRCSHRRRVHVARGCLVCTGEDCCTSFQGATTDDPTIPRDADTATPAPEEAN